jgi:nicotinamide riboside kinase
MFATVSPPIFGLSVRQAQRRISGASFGKTGLAVAINDVLKRRSVAEWRRRFIFSTL